MDGGFKGEREKKKMVAVVNVICHGVRSLSVRLASGGSDVTMVGDVHKSQASPPLVWPI